ncbi:hypothetical protein L1987_73712 [Smallanthus sonchifolius]|uniref:Uncharacterized protein n=1 Tax=Smallanthus sonchifolius TaxID=185202 RepID=A0ACB9A1X6_9ASTR|nr:hypothetical protein L1987_73712 [Smallanthus sonchifolius]
MKHKQSFLFFFFFLFFFSNGTTITVVNDCGFTVWPGISGSPVLNITGFELTEGNSRSFQFPDDWSGGLWGRTGCTFNGSGHGSCEIGDCGSGEMECNERLANPPATVAGFDFKENTTDMYGVSILNGYNLQMTVEATSDYFLVDRLKTGCVYDLNKRCPVELSLEGGGGCKNACQKIHKFQCTVYAKSKQLNGYDQHASISGNFKLGFFENYLGIWYTDDAEARKVWVANPNNPILSTSDIIVLSIDRNTGNLIITAGGTTVMKISDVQAGPNPNVTATLQDTGNFRLINEFDKKVLWQSFDHPTNVLLPGMKLGYDTRTKQNWTLTSWLSDDIPDSGAFTFWEPINETDQRLMIRRRGQPYWTSGFASIMTATNDFSAENKLGQGGFGPVYKGRLNDGREIAIKRLSRSSGQGLVEFKNELILIARLQHTNLVRILGCCIHGEEKMLIYEYMPNKSLDFFLFDENKKLKLDWPKRFNIIEGIAQGLLYLHKYSRMRVIHRELKSDNILLDESMNPKISDFGMARMFNQNETQATTNRVVGTYGYISPEYAMEGTFSIKSDIYNFGVLILEILGGRRNSSFVHLDRTVNLLGYAWELWQQGNALELEDPTLGSTYVVQQFSRTFQVALLCVQESALDRPTTSDMISMLLNDTISLPAPKRPAFFTRGVESNSTLDHITLEECSANDVTISVIEGR